MDEVKPTIAASGPDNLLLRLRDLFTTDDPQLMSSNQHSENTWSHASKLGAAFGNLRRNMPKILAASLAGVALAATYLMFAKPEYTSTAQLLFNPDRSKIAVSDGADVPYTPDFTYVESQVSVLQSSIVLKRVVDALHLTDDPDYVRKDERSGLERIGAVFSGDATPADPGAAALAKLGSSLAVTRKLKTYIVTVAAHASSPAKAAAVVDAVLTSYIAEQMPDLSASAASTTAQSATRLAQLREELRAAEAVASRGVAGKEKPPGGNTDKAHANAANNKVRYDQTEKALTTSAGKGSVAGNLSPQTLQTMRNRLAAASQQVVALSAKLGERHPDLIEAKAQVVKIKTEVDAELRKMAAAARADYEAAKSNGTSLKANNEPTPNPTAPSLHEQPSTAAADIATLRARIEAQEALDGKMPGAFLPLQARVINPPSLPTQPTSPRPRIVLGIGLLSGIGLGLAWALLAGAFDNHVRTAGDLAHHLERGKIVPIPALKEHASFQIPSLYPIAADASLATQFGDMMLALRDPQASDTASYRQAVLRLLAKVKSQQRPGRPHAVTLVAPHSGAGTSATALALAYSAAIAGERVLLVDATSINPEISMIFAASLKPDRPIELDSKDDLNAITTRDDGSGLIVLPIALVDLRTLKTQQRRRLVAGFNGIVQNFDLIFIDAGAVLEDESAVCLLQTSDQVIAVANAGMTTHPDVAATLQLLEPVKNKVTAGVLVTKVSSQLS